MIQKSRMICSGASLILTKMAHKIQTMVAFLLI
jgi:hypothetical protein